MPNTGAADFGKRLRELREQAQLTRAELAERAGLHLQGVVKIERAEREPGWSTVLALAAALGVDCTAFQQEPADRSDTGPGRPPRAKGVTPATRRPRGRPKKGD